ncbi:FmtA-like protein [Legionella massiliensis]|uniref:FmtA-like protein n=2 Tax=Legionella massiliensis TaxID=1034943 RepID=A0A078L184_9GAMM|nr:FmtA-like protein [Legionella massiliensis]CEE14725.1 Esterase EstB [Legionella massiliensis]
MQILYAHESSTDFAKWLEQGMQTYHIPGISIAVIEDYKLIYSQGFGWADKENHKPVTTDTLFQAGSISKPVTAVAVLKTVQDNKLALDENVNSFLKSWKVPANEYRKSQPITLRELLSHSAGFNVPGFLGYAKGEKLPSLLEVLDGVAPANSPAIRVSHPVRKEFIYSGGGYTVVQQLLIDTYKEPFPNLMAQLVLDPLAMSSSSFQQPFPTADKNVALPYRRTGLPLAGGPHTYVEEAAAGLWTKPQDLAKFIISIQKSLRGDQDQLLTQHSAELFSVLVQAESKDKKVQMGLGAVVSLNKDGKATKQGRYFAHAGQNEGYRNLFIASTKTGNAIIIMTNMSPPQDEIDKGWDFIYQIVLILAQINHWK